MVAGPEIARIVVEFEEYAMKAQDDGKQLHHEQHFSVQHAFQKDVKSLIAVFEEFGNPFLEKGQDLLVLDTRDIMDSSIGETVLGIEALGEDQYKKLIEEWLQKCEKPSQNQSSKISCLYSVDQHLNVILQGSRFKSQH